MGKCLSVLALAVLLLPAGLAAQAETLEGLLERLRWEAQIRGLVEAAKTDRLAAQMLFSGVNEAALLILDDPASRETLSYELDTYFDEIRYILAGEFGPVPDATRDLIAEASVQLAIADPLGWHQELVVEAGKLGFERADEALFHIYQALRAKGDPWDTLVLMSYEDRPLEPALPYLSRLLAQQDDGVAAMIAIEIMAQAGQVGADAILALEREGTINDYVWRSIRWGRDGTDEVCPHVPEFTPCVHNKILGNPVGTMQISCRDLPKIREAFEPGEYEDMFRRLCGADDDGVPLTL